MNCSGCGKEIPNDAKFCFDCGAKVNQVLICKGCGKELPEGAKFCFDCGTSVAGAVKKQEEPVKAAAFTVPAAAPVMPQVAPVFNQPLQASDIKYSKGLLKTEYSCIYDNKLIRYERTPVSTTLYVGNDVINPNAMGSVKDNFLSDFAFKPMCVLESNYQFSTGVKTIKIYVKSVLGIGEKHKVCIDEEYVCGDVF